jgi:hypothetical protein
MRAIIGRLRRCPGQELDDEPVEELGLVDRQAVAGAGTTATAGQALAQGQGVLDGISSSSSTMTRAGPG